MRTEAVGGGIGELVGRLGLVLWVGLGTWGPAIEADADSIAPARFLERSMDLAASTRVEAADEVDVATSPGRGKKSWDHREGIDDNGRIPAVMKNVSDPERWRYIPEGRIKPGPP